MSGVSLVNICSSEAGKRGIGFIGVADADELPLDQEGTVVRSAGRADKAAFRQLYQRRRHAEGE
jgi:hypothetical protein